MRRCSQFPECLSSRVQAISACHGLLCEVFAYLIIEEGSIAHHRCEFVSLDPFLPPQTLCKRKGFSPQTIAGLVQGPVEPLTNVSVFPRVMSK